MFVGLFSALILTVFERVDFVGEFADSFFEFLQLLFVDVSHVERQEESTINFYGGTVCNFRVMGLLFMEDREVISARFRAMEVVARLI